MNEPGYRESKNKSRRLVSLGGLKCSFLPPPRQVARRSKRIMTELAPRCGGRSSQDHKGLLRPLRFLLVSHLDRGEFVFLKTNQACHRGGGQDADRQLQPEGRVLTSQGKEGPEKRQKARSLHGEAQPTEEQGSQKGVGRGLKPGPLVLKERAVEPDTRDGMGGQTDDQDVLESQVSWPPRATSLSDSSSSASASNDSSSSCNDSSSSYRERTYSSTSSSVPVEQSVQPSCSMRAVSNARFASRL